ncbi:MAG: ion transporter [Alphaproteobacteria bacterium]|nr:ion transporter [Alphaproteobacteria bacterium]
MGLIEKIVDNKTFQWFIIGVILANAAILGLMTMELTPETHHLLEVLDNACLVIFCIEIAMKLLVRRLAFFKDGWNVFDLIVVGIALAPATGELAVLRALRVLRLMRLASAIPSMRRVINGMFAAIPGGGSVAAVLFVMYYVAAIMGTNFFGKTVPAHFGDLGTTFFTLFKMMTLEGWPDIASDVLEHHPRAWIFFVIFIVFTTFTTLNLLFGIIVDAMEQAKEADARTKMAEQGVEMSEESNEMRLAIIEGDVKYIRTLLTEMAPDKVPHRPAGE